MGCSTVPDQGVRPVQRSLDRFLTTHTGSLPRPDDLIRMPSTAGHRDERPRPEFVLGDRYGTSCVGVVAETVEKTLRALGYTVSRNKPYAGGFITEHYGNPAAGLHAIQLEINRALYMDERRYQRSSTFDRLAADLETLARRLGEIPLEQLRPYRAAAE